MWRRAYCSNPGNIIVNMKFSCSGDISDWCLWVKILYSPWDSWHYFGEISWKHKTTILNFVLRTECDSFEHVPLSSSVANVMYMWRNDTNWNSLYNIHISPNCGLSRVQSLQQVWEEWAVCKKKELVEKLKKRQVGNLQVNGKMILNSETDRIWRIGGDFTDSYQR
jgi:hypothetical protein